MYQVIVRLGRKVIHKERFATEQAAWDFFDLYSDTGTCEFRDLSVLKAI